MSISQKQERLEFVDQARVHVARLLMKSSSTRVRERLELASVDLDVVERWLQESDHQTPVATEAIDYALHLAVMRLASADQLVRNSARTPSR